MTEPEDQKKSSVLIVEDDHALSRILESTFLVQGYTVYTAYTGIEGLKQYSQYHPDIILLDILMPDMTGIEMLRELRKDAQGSDTPVIMLTNYNDVEKEQEARSLGILHYFVKADSSLDLIVEKTNESLNEKHPAS